MRSSKWIERQSEKQKSVEYICLFLIILAVISNGGKLFLAIIYDVVLERMNELNMKGFLLLGISSVIVIIIISTINLLQRIFSEKYKQREIADRQRKMIEELERKKLDKLEKISEGEWITLLSDDVEQCAGEFFEFVLPFSVGIVSFITSLCTGFCLSVKLTLIVMICCAVSLLIPKFFMEKVQNIYNRKIHNKEELQENLLQPLHFKSLIKAYYYEDKCEKNFETMYKDYGDECIAEKMLSAAMTGISIGSAFTISSLWMIIGIFFMIEGSVSVGDFAAFMMLNDYLNWPFVELGSLLEKRTKIGVSSERLENYLAIENEERDLKETDEPNQISFTKVTFSYENSDEMVFEDKNIELCERDRIAIVGESGKGKTTLCKLLAGGYYPSKGDLSINFDGKKYFKEAIRNIVGYMPQKSQMFSGTIEENIRIGKDGATREEIRNFARIACVDRFVDKLPDGYETVVGNNSKCQLSGGEVARVALARTLIRKTPIYILDEFSAALDEDTERQIINNLKEIDAIIICVTHRESTMRFCNKVIDTNIFISNRCV